MNEQTSLSAQQYIRCGKRSANALKSVTIFGGGFLLTFLVYIIVYYLINPGYAAIAAIITARWDADLLGSIRSVPLKKPGLTIFSITNLLTASAPAFRCPPACLCMRRFGSAKRR